MEQLRRISVFTMGSLRLHISAISALRNYDFCLISILLLYSGKHEQAPPSGIAGYVCMFVTAYLLNGTSTVTCIVARLTVPVLKSITNEGFASNSSVRAITV